MSVGVTRLTTLFAMPVGTSATTVFRPMLAMSLSCSFFPVVSLVPRLVTSISLLGSPTLRTSNPKLRAGHSVSATVFGAPQYQSRACWQPGGASPLDCQS